MKATPTMAEFVGVYMKEHALNPKKKPRSGAGDRRQFDVHILPDLKVHKLAEITRADMAKLHAKTSETPVQANWVLAPLRKLMNLAEE